MHNNGEALRDQSPIWHIKHVHAAASSRFFVQMLYLRCVLLREYCNTTLMCVLYHCAVAFVVELAESDRILRIRHAHFTSKKAQTRSPYMKRNVPTCFNVTKVRIFDPL